MTAEHQGHDVRTTISAIHHGVVSDVLHLLDGFYLNIEDGLFELAYRSADEAQRRRCFDLMRELRFRRAALVKSFNRVMEHYRPLWFREQREEIESVSTNAELERLVMKMAEKSHAHFGGVLQVITERSAQATGRDFRSPHELPISPRRIARAFVHSCRTLKLDTGSIEIIQQLFRRFVLDGLGVIYGDCNQRLAHHGFLTQSETQALSSA